ncbi:Tfp pilus assembly protein FimT/FimU [Phenylobacterium sp.]|jgi:prepilin-type N-terminal cleavage/methylation domain-containing protein|uniref:Tfp pilus assembly protein FimT/FimU n=1 Tax=Phenylobacterium sp. TaxID=1871053 RepID=UPI0037C59CC5
MIQTRPRRAFTLIELLVVTGLLASLFAMVVGGLGAPNIASAVRRTAQDLASRLLAVQSRALGKPEGAALIVAPNTENTRMGTIILDAVTQPWVIAAVSSGMPPSNPRVTSAAVTVETEADVLASAFKIRFQSDGGDDQVSPGASPWFAFMSGTVGFRGSAGQTLANTIWPKTASQAEQAVVARYPSPGISTKEMAKQVAIDLRHSGMGEDPDAAHGYGRFESKGSIAIAYEQIGRVGEVMRRVQETRTATDQPIEPNGVIYFLVVSRADILEGRNTLANPQSVWVAINPHTGRVTVAENVPQVTEDKTAITAARRSARAGTAIK